MYTKYKRINMIVSVIVGVVAAAILAGFMTLSHEAAAVSSLIAPMVH